MRNIRLNEQFDIVLIYDSIAYMTTENDLRLVFETAFAHLKQGGMILTVAEETPEKFRQFRTRVQTHSNNGLEITYFEHYYDPNPNDTIYDLLFVYLIRQNGDLRVELDQHICGIFSLDTWEGLLRDVGFEPQNGHFTFSEKSPEEQYPVLIGYKPFKRN